MPCYWVQYAEGAIKTTGIDLSNVESYNHKNIEIINRTHDVYIYKEHGLRP